MTENRIAQALSRLFERHRIVFWYDAKQELREEYEEIQLNGVEKIELSSNEFGVKHRVLREHSQQKCLLYRYGPQPDDLDNWLLDVQLAQGEFRTDQVALWLSELDLGMQFADIVQNHTEFFRAVRRRETLKRLLKPDDTPSLIRTKMVAVCAGADSRIDSILENLLAELAGDKDEKTKLIGRCDLDGFLWDQMARHFGYRSDEPSIRGFVIELFKSCYAMGTDGEPRLTGDALVFLKRWKDSRPFEKSFEALSDECAELLDIEQDLGNRDFRTLIEMDYFQLIDRKIISDLVREVTSRTVSKGDVASWIRQRRQGHWYGEFSHLYEAVDNAEQFIHAMDEANLTMASMASMADGVQKYSDNWFRLDQLYRKFTYHVRMSGMASLMGPLSDQMENIYSNSYLLKVNDRWQSFVDATSKWDASPVPLQKNFFELWVQPFLNKGNKVFVIISDAMRYEIGDELLSLIRQEDRYEASLEPALSMLPSYTQLGMAALLPNKELAIADNETSIVYVDEQSSQGTPNRIKILAEAISQRATALRAEELLGMNRDDSRTLVRDHDVIYIYHNRIDATGDKRESEERTFEAVEETLHELILILKKLTAANANNLLVTSDHGFIYQHRAIDESDFAGNDAEGDQILFRNRRFVLGKGLKEASGLRKFHPSELGLTEGVEVLIPKSINRLRQQGSGSRFVHGGASLQEVVIPVVRINKKRQSDISIVDVDILPSSSSMLTSGQLAVAFYQVQSVTDKVQPRNLRAGIYSQAGDLISDSHKLAFDLTSDNPRERELHARFVLTGDAEEANNQEVILRLEEKLAGTTYYKEYKSVRYTLRRSFTSDFDF